MKIVVTGKLQYRSPKASGTFRLNQEAGEELSAVIHGELGDLGLDIREVGVRLTDINGPRGGVDTRCVIQVLSSGSEPTIVVVEVGNSMSHTVKAASAVARRALLRRVSARRDRDRSTPPLDLAG
ncbi:MAG: hypothetical protein ACI9OJ_002649 [Myxococcota bacterium]|jgi:hypothetical protein